MVGRLGDSLEFSDHCQIEYAGLAILVLTSARLPVIRVRTPTG